MTEFPIVGGDSADPVTPDLMAQMGADFWCRYLCTYPDTSEDFKRVTPAEVAAIAQGGKRIVFNWETDGKPDDGFATGVSAAKQAEVELFDRGAVGACVIFSFADPDSSEPDIPKVLDAINGAVSVMGWDRVGLYGRFDVVKACLDGNHCRLAWQTYGQSYGQWDGRAQLRQCRNGLSDHGVGHDYDEAWAEDFGQWPRPASSAPAAPPPPPGLLPGGAIEAHYNALPQALRDALGAVLTPELTCPDGVGRFNHLQNGSIYWTPATGAHVVQGCNRDAWRDLGWEAGRLGYPLSDEFPGPGGPTSLFEHGWIDFWAGASRAHF